VVNPIFSRRSRISVGIPGSLDYKIICTESRNWKTSPWCQSLLVTDANRHTAIAITARVTSLCWTSYKHNATHSRSSGACSYRSISAARARTAKSSRCRSTGETTGRTDTRPLRRPFTAYYSCSINKICAPVSVRVTETNVWCARIPAYRTRRPMSQSSDACVSVTRPIGAIYTARCLRGEVVTSILINTKWLK